MTGRVFRWRSGDDATARWLLHEGRRIAAARTAPDALLAFREAVTSRLARTCAVVAASGARETAADPHTLIVPLRASERVLAVVEIAPRTSGHDFTPRERELIEDLATRTALVMASMRADEAERDGAAAVDRMNRLQRVADIVSGAISLREVTSAALDAAIEVFGAFAGGIVMSDTGGRLSMADARGFPADLTAAFHTFPADEPTPVLEAMATRQPLYFRDREEVAQRFPAAARTLYRTPDVAYAAVPLLSGERSIGALILAFASTRAMYAHDRVFVAALARQLALAVTRAQYVADEQRARSVAESAVAAREDFLSVAAHELRTPLTTLSLHTDGLAREAVFADVPAQSRPAMRLGAMRRQVQRLSRLVDVLLDVSRATVRAEDFVRESVDLVAIAREVADSLAAEAAAARSVLRLAAERAVVGQWDRLRIEQVVTNLMGNAIKFGAGGEIEVSVASDGDDAVLQVRDHGIGIPADAQARVFERFERAVSSQHYVGLGLGLWIVRAIVEAHGGTIAVDSTAGEGSTFVVRLPLRAK